MTASAGSSKMPPPPFRRLRAFAFDPSLSRRIATADINQVTLKIPWDSSLGKGPVADRPTAQARSDFPLFPCPRIVGE